MLTGYPLGYRLPGRPGLAGYYGVSELVALGISADFLPGLGDARLR